MNKFFLFLAFGSLLLNIGCGHSTITSERTPADTGMGSGGTGTGATGLPDNPCVFHITGTRDPRVIRVIANKMKKNGYEYTTNSILNLVIVSTSGTGTGAGGTASGLAGSDFFETSATARVKVQLQHGTNDSQLYAIASAETKAAYGSTNIAEALGEAIEKISNCPGILK